MGAPAYEFDAGDVDAAVGREVAALGAAGLNQGDSVGWLALNGPRALVLLKACEQCGLRYVPLNWRLAPPELATIARHAGLQALWHDEAVAPLAAQVTALLRLPEPVAPGHRTGDLMLVYTSGTTGEPKGAIHTAAAMRANIDAAIDAQAFDAQTRTLAALPLFHVGGLCIQVLPTLAAGGRVRLHERFDAAAWLRDVAAWRPTTSLLVPATMRALVEHPDWPRTDLSSLEFVNSGSSIVPRDLIGAFHARGVPVCQVYGATETGPVTIVLRREEAVAHAGKAGLPARGVDVRLVDGEIWVRGANVARGYHREEGHPAFADGWFRTGDLAQRDDDGRYEIVGRRKEVIISGGENIHPAEIEQVALADPCVAEAAAVGLPDLRWGEVPALAIVARPGLVVDVAALRASFDARLARFKHPRRIVVLDGLPKTALGKVRRADLARALLDGTQAKG
ncbi:MAG: AMP-binding protein [Aquincola sp.]|nr:AMP-binding protein [Aquincola sp.]MDH5329601.1 AMP-binding protein [Aquincola sp.]